MKFRALLIYILVLLEKSSFCTLYNQLSDFERKAVDQAMAAYNLEPEKDPENKIITNIYVFTQEPFSKEAGFLALLNRLHVNTKESIIRRELFVKIGDAYDSALIQNSELALRRLAMVRSMAIIVPMRRDKPHEVALLVASRDILSLRPNFSFSASSWTLRDLELSLSLGEYNLLGYNKALSGAYELKQGMHIFSSRYFDPNLFGSRFEFMLRPGLIFARDTFKLDGFLAEFELKRPLISMTEKWGYGIEGQLGVKPVIDFKGGYIRKYKSLSGEEIERRYRWAYGEGKIYVRRSFGSVHKKEIFANYTINIKRPSIPQDLKLSEESREEFIKKILPRNELESFINLGAAYFQNRFLTLYDYNNFKLQEVKTLGPAVKISNDFASKPLLFSDHSFLRPHYSLAYTQDFTSNSFMMLSTSGSNRWDKTWTDNTFKFGLSVVSPHLFDFMRIIIDARLSMTLNNRDNQKFTLGSDSGLRGVESRFYSGTKAFRTNLELRSKPIDIWILHAGLVLFYDAGAAFDKLRDANATHSIGFGLRVLAPQLSSDLFRIDLGFPVCGRGVGKHIVVPSLGLGQAFN